MFKFGSTSKERLSTCHRDLQIIFNAAIETSKVDFGIAQGHRSVDQQQKLYRSGRDKAGPILTYVDGIEKKSKHNYSPSQAVDIYAYYNGKAQWDKEHLIYLGGHIMATAATLKAAGTIQSSLRWGGNWDSDGIIISDQNFMDLPHYEKL